MLITQNVVLDVLRAIYAQYVQQQTSPFINLFRATITSDSNTGYYISTNNVGSHSEYIHNNKVDGSTKYGAALNSFPRRNAAGGYYAEGITQCGSRSIAAYINTARTVSNFSPSQYTYMVI